MRIPGLTRETTEHAGWWSQRIDVRAEVEQVISRDSKLRGHALNVSAVRHANRLCLVRCFFHRSVSHFACWMTSWQARRSTRFQSAASFTVGWTPIKLSSSRRALALSSVCLRFPSRMMLRLSSASFRGKRGGKRTVSELLCLFVMNSIDQYDSHQRATSTRTDRHSPNINSETQT